MKNNINIRFIIILILVILVTVIITGYFRKRYISFLPTIPVYPNSYTEVKKVQEQVSTITPSDIEFYKLTDPSIKNAFLPYVNETREELIDIIIRVSPIIKFFKYTINRPRPKQINPQLIVLESTTAHTPAYPAGHALQAYYLSKVLSKRYPDKKEQFDNIAKRCDLVRVKAGLHYPSDGKFSKAIVDALP